MVVWIVLGLLLIVLFAVGIVWLVRRASSDGGRPTDHQHPPSTGTGSGTAREDLDRRYARGEISREEYLAIRDDLESWRTVPTGAGPLGPGCGPLPPVRSSVLSALPSHEADRPAAPETRSSVTLDRVPFRVPVTARVVGPNDNPNHLRFVKALLDVVTLMIVVVHSACWPRRPTRIRIRGRDAQASDGTTHRG